MLGILAALLVGTLLGGLTDEKNVSKVGDTAMINLNLKVFKK